MAFTSASCHIVWSHRHSYSVLWPAPRGPLLMPLWVPQIFSTGVAWWTQYLPSILQLFVYFHSFTPAWSSMPSTYDTLMVYEFFSYFYSSITRLYYEYLTSFDALLGSLLLLLDCLLCLVLFSDKPNPCISFLIKGLEK